jgi:hypothetical protein
MSEFAATERVTVRASERGVNLNRIGRAANRRQDNRSEEERRVIDDVHRVFAALLIELSFFAERGARMRGVNA